MENPQKGLGWHKKGNNPLHDGEEEGEPFTAKKIKKGKLQKNSMDEPKKTMSYEGRLKKKEIRMETYSKKIKMLEQKGIGKQGKNHR